MKQWKMSLSAALLAGVLLCAGCGTQAATEGSVSGSASAGSAAVGSGSGAAATETVTENQQQQAMDLAETIFGIDPEKYQTVENTVEDGVTQEDGMVEIRMEGGENSQEIVAGWTADSELPTYLYQVDGEDTSGKTPEKYPKNMVKEAETLLTDTLSVSDELEVSAVYAYADRLSVLFASDAGTYYHVAFTAKGDAIEGYQIFTSGEAAETFYQKQSAVALKKF